MPDNRGLAWLAGEALKSGTGLVATNPTDNTVKKPDQSIDALFESIARQHLRIETLETRKSDSLDFHEVAVWGVKDALLAAYEAGRAGAKSGKAKR